MTRIAIVARSEALRSALAEALGEHAEFDVVDAAATRSELHRGAEVVLVAERSTGEDGREEHLGLGAGDVAAQPGMLLTAREREVLQLLADGLGNKQIAVRLGISTSTVKTHVEELFERLDVASRAEAVAVGVRRGLLML